MKTFFKALSLTISISLALSVLPASAAQTAKVSVSGNSLCNVVASENFDGVDAEFHHNPSNQVSSALGSVTIKDNSNTDLTVDVLSSEERGQYLKVEKKATTYNLYTSEDGDGGSSIAFDVDQTKKRIKVSYKICFTELGDAEGVSESSPRGLLGHLATQPPGVVYETSKGYTVYTFIFNQIGEDKIKIGMGGAFKTGGTLTGEVMTTNEWYTVEQYIEEKNVSTLVTDSSGNVILNKAVTHGYKITPLINFSVGDRGKYQCGECTFLLDDYSIENNYINITAPESAYENGKIEFDADIVKGYTSLEILYDNETVYTGGAIAEVGTKHHIVIPTAGSAGEDKAILLRATYPGDVVVEESITIDVIERVRCESVKENIIFYNGTQVLTDPTQILAGDVIKADISLTNITSSDKEYLYVLTRRAGGKLSGMNAKTVSLSEAGSEYASKSFTLTLPAAEEGGGEVYLLVFDSYGSCIPLGEFIEIK